MPVVVDYLGGLLGEAALAFGAASGIAHGIGERERFSASGWEKAPKPRQEGQPQGKAVRIGHAGMNKSLTVKEFEVLCSARGGKRLMVIGGRQIGDMIEDHRKISAEAAFAHVGAPSQIPDLHRGRHFLQKRSEPAARAAREIKDLKPKADEAAKREVDLDKLMKRMSEHSQKMEKINTSLEHQYEEWVDRDGRPLSIRRTPPANGMSDWRSR